MGTERRDPGRGALHAESHEASAETLDSHADALWAYAGDCDRWGLGSDAAAARKKTVKMRVDALLRRAVVPGLGIIDDPDRG